MIQRSSCSRRACSPYFPVFLWQECGEQARRLHGSPLPPTRSPTADGVRNPTRFPARHAGWPIKVSILAIFARSYWPSLNDKGCRPDRKCRSLLGRGCCRVAAGRVGPCDGQPNRFATMPRLPCVAEFARGNRRSTCDRRTEQPASLLRAQRCRLFDGRASTARPRRCQRLELRRSGRGEPRELCHQHSARQGNAAPRVRRLRADLRHPPLRQ